MTTCDIRPLTPEDRADWQRLWAQYNAFYGREGETALSAEIVNTTWQRLLDPAEPVEGLLAVLNGEAVGLAHYVLHRNLIQTEDTCYLQDLFTTEAARGSGVGRQLIEATMESCRARGIKDIYWHTHGGNETARRLYDKIATDTDFTVYRRRIE